MGRGFVFYARPLIDASGKDSKPFIPDFTPPSRLPSAIIKRLPGRWTRAKELVHRLMNQKGRFTITEIVQGTGYSRKQVSDLVWEMRRAGLQLTRAVDSVGFFYYPANNRKASIMSEISFLSRKIQKLANELRDIDANANV